ECAVWIREIINVSRLFASRSLGSPESDATYIGSDAATAVAILEARSEARSSEEVDVCAAIVVQRKRGNAWRKEATPRRRPKQDGKHCLIRRMIAPRLRGSGFRVRRSWFGVQRSGSAFGVVPQLDS